MYLSYKNRWRYSMELWCRYPDQIWRGLCANQQTPDLADPHGWLGSFEKAHISRAVFQTYRNDLTHF